MGKLKRHLVVRGEPGVIGNHGLEGFAKQFDLVSLAAEKKTVSGAGEEWALVDLSVDPPDSALVDCLKRIKTSFEEKFPDEGHLGHAAAGLFWFYFHDDELNSMERLFLDGRVGDLRAATERWIEVWDFGRESAQEVACST